MGRVYAGILGPLAMTVVICRGWFESGGVEGTLILATMHLVVFAVVLTSVAIMRYRKRTS